MCAGEYCHDFADNSIPNEIREAAHYSPPHISMHCLVNERSFSKSANNL